ncbi:hypothetical protein KP509_19G016900 [Ceratopteris richardii]|uniref:NAD-dependent epimerase/dehydratase domain-containing protein n=1 Tax=Ceratopteris richardii TaxID=49495 RepID=A0A8T2SKD6_CERRI|nr:hypothetical protein KP509_19G016900 [Ceratopteris richardii]
MCVHLDLAPLQGMTFENPYNAGERETKHLRALEGAQSRLELFAVDLLDYESLAAAIGKSVGVFHLATPVFLHKPDDPQKELIEPAVQGTTNVLKACHAARVRRIVVTSSVSAMVPNPHLPPDVAVDENCWTDIEYCKQHEVWYPLSKVLAEKVTWSLAAELGLNVVVINPGCVLGPMLQPTLNASSSVVLNLLKGDRSTQANTWLGVVHVKDVARALILLYETAHAEGRHLCTETISHFSDFAEEVSQIYPQYNVHRFKEDTHPWLLRSTNPSKKLLELGFKFTPTHDTIKDTVVCLQERGLLS